MSNFKIVCGSKLAQETIINLNKSFAEILNLDIGRREDDT